MAGAMNSSESSFEFNLQHLQDALGAVKHYFGVYAGDMRDVLNTVVGTPQIIRAYTGHFFQAAHEDHGGDHVNGTFPDISAGVRQEDVPYSSPGHGDYMSDSGSNYSIRAGPYGRPQGFRPSEAGHVEAGPSDFGHNVFEHGPQEAWAPYFHPGQSDFGHNVFEHGRQEASFPYFHPGQSDFGRNVFEHGPHEDVQGVEGLSQRQRSRSMPLDVQGVEGLSPLQRPRSMTLEAQRPPLGTLSSSYQEDERPSGTLSSQEMQDVQGVEGPRQRSRSMTQDGRPFGTLPSQEMQDVQGVEGPRQRSRSMTLEAQRPLGTPLTSHQEDVQGVEGLSPLQRPRSMTLEAQRPPLGTLSSSHQEDVQGVEGRSRSMTQEAQRPLGTPLSSYQEDVQGVEGRSRSMTQAQRPPLGTLSSSYQEDVEGLSPLQRSRPMPRDEQSSQRSVHFEMPISAQSSVKDSESGLESLADSEQEFRLQPPRLHRSKRVDLEDLAVESVASSDEEPLARRPQLHRSKTRQARHQSTHHLHHHHLSELPEERARYWPEDDVESIANQSVVGGLSFVETASFPYTDRLGPRFATTKSETNRIIRSHDQVFGDINEAEAASGNFKHGLAEYGQSVGILNNAFAALPGHLRNYVSQAMEHYASKEPERIGSRVPSRIDLNATRFRRSSGGIGQEELSEPGDDETRGPREDGNYSEDEEEEEEEADS